MDVRETVEVSDELEEALARLVGQLSSSSPPPTRDELEEIVAARSTRLLIVRGSDGTILGTLTLALFRIPTGLRAWIEDVVVDEAARGQGAAQALVKAGLAIAVEHGARTVDLTSRPSREAANRLYLKLGFVQRETNVYRWSG